MVAFGAPDETETGTETETGLGWGTGMGVWAVIEDMGIEDVETGLGI